MTLGLRPRRLLGPLSRPPRDHLARRRRRGRRSTASCRRSIRGRRLPPTATIVFNGDKMQSAAERYRTGKIIQPKGLGTTSTWKQAGHRIGRRARFRYRLREVGANRARSPPTQDDSACAAIEPKRRRTRRWWWCSPPIPSSMQSVRTTFSAAAQIDLRIVAGTVTSHEDMRSSVDDATVVVVDLDAGRDARDGGVAAPDGAHRRLAAGRRRHRSPSTRRWRASSCRCGSPTSWSSRCSRSNWCAPARGSCRRPSGPEPSEAEIFTYLPAVGGAGVTTLAIQTALLLLNNGQKTRPATCLVDLDFQHGACADYLDLEPRLDLKRDRAAAGAARPPAARGHDLLSRLRSRRDRRAEPAGRNAHASIPTW